MYVFISSDYMHTSKWIQKNIHIHKDITLTSSTASIRLDRAGSPICKGSMCVVKHARGHILKRSRGSGDSTWMF